MQEWLGWYLAPWRRVGRMTFNVVLTLASLPSLLMGFFGDGGGGFMAPLLGALNGGGESGGMSPDALAAMGESLQRVARMPGVAPQPGVLFDWALLVNNSLMVLLLPLVQMRLRDMGKGGKWLWPLTVGAYGGVVAGFSGMAGLGWGGVGTVVQWVSFLMLLWLCSARTQVVDTPKPWERIPVGEPRALSVGTDPVALREEYGAGSMEYGKKKDGF